MYTRLHVKGQLRQYFLTVVAPELDTPDPLRHFGIVIPDLATSCPALSLALLAVAAAHAERSDAVNANDFVTVGQGFQEACFEALSLDDISDAEIFDPPILAAIALLRLAVQTSRSPSIAVNSLPPLQLFAEAWKASPSSALHGAIFLTALQYDVRIAWQDRQPIPRPNIGVCLMRYVCTQIDDPRIWVARAIMLVSQALRYCYGDPEEKTLDAWLQINVSSESWVELKPESFDALVDEEAAEREPCEKLLYRESIHALAQVHSMLARLLLVSHAPPTIRQWASEKSRKLETKRLLKRLRATAEGHRESPSVVLASTLATTQWMP